MTRASTGNTQVRLTSDVERRTSNVKRTTHDAQHRTPYGVAPNPEFATRTVLATFTSSVTMNPTPVKTSDEGDIRRSRALARVLDSAVGIPGTPLRVGLDAILGLIPGAGDMIAGALSGYIVLTAVRHGAPGPVIARMLGNVILDTAIGAIPILGDLFDVAYKANMKNVALLEGFSMQPEVVTARSRRLGVVVVIVIALVVVAVGVLGFLVARLLWRLLTS